MSDKILKTMYLLVNSACVSCIDDYSSIIFKEKNSSDHSAIILDLLLQYLKISLIKNERDRSLLLTQRFHQK